MNIILFGFKGAGKTHLGKLLGKCLKRPFVDTDDLIVKKYCCPVRELYHSVGEVKFREIEREIIREIELYKSCVIALGGGAILDLENRRRLQTMGRLVYVKASFATVQERILKEGIPAFTRGKDLANIYSERIPIYESIPSICVDVDLCDEVGCIDQICESWHRTILDKSLESPLLESPTEARSGS